MITTFGVGRRVRRSSNGTSNGSVRVSACIFPSSRGIMGELALKEVIDVHCADVVPRSLGQDTVDRLSTGQPLHELTEASSGHARACVLPEQPQGTRREPVNAGRDQGRGRILGLLE